MKQPAPFFSSIRIKGWPLSKVRSFEASFKKRYKTVKVTKEYLLYRTPIKVKTVCALGDFAKRPRVVKKRKRNWWIVVLLLAIYTVVCYIAITNHVRPHKFQEGAVKINLSPIRFTEYELKTFYDKNLAPRKAEAATEASAGHVTELVREYFGDVADKMLICLKSENGAQRAGATYKNKNGSVDVGIMQINTPTHCSKIGEKDWANCIEKLKDPETNIKVGYQIWEGRGFNAWYGKTCRQFWN